MNDTDIMQRALEAIKKLKAQLQQQQNQQINREPIAIVGISCRLPQINDKEDFWKLLVRGGSVIGPLPEERRTLLKNTCEDNFIRSGNFYQGGYLTAIDFFDAYFFGISPREALCLDPQQRLLLEMAYEAFEDAGMTLEQLAGSKTGVFSSLYHSRLPNLVNQYETQDALFLATGNATNMAANRISYFFNLYGPSMVVDSACSSSLTALHQACLALQNQLCEAAIVNAVHINLLPSTYDLLSKANMLSPSGQCKTFSENADGYVPGEGCGAIILKPLSKALKNNDRIYAVITDSLINEDGRTNGLTAPNGLQQESLLKEIYAHTATNMVNYLECHGTGTKLGDPIEIESLGRALNRKGQERKTTCWLGSVKTNVGHLEPAAGIISVIKTALCLYHQKLVPHLNADPLNPLIQLDKYHFKISRSLQDWPLSGEYRSAGVSSFGFGGSNAHVVLRELTSNEYSKQEEQSVKHFEIFTLSAKNELALKELIERYYYFLKDNRDLSLAVLCYHLHLRKNHFEQRLIIVAESTIEVFRLLSEIKIKPNGTVNKIYCVDEKRVDQNTLEIAQHYINKQPVDWMTYEKDRKLPFIDLPGYPWQRKSYWPKNQVVLNSIVINQHPLNPQYFSSAQQQEYFIFDFVLNSLPELYDTYQLIHVGFYLEMLAYLAHKINPDKQISITGLKFKSPMMVQEALKVQYIVENINDAAYFKIYSLSLGGHWQEHAHGHINFIEFSSQVFPIEDFKKKLSPVASRELFSKRIKQMNMPCSGSIFWTENFWHQNNQILCYFKNPEVRLRGIKYSLKIHPGIFDACIQTLLYLVSDQQQKPYITIVIESIEVNTPFEDCEEFYVYTTLNQSTPQVKGDCYLLNRFGESLVELKGIVLNAWESIALEKGTTNLTEIIAQLFKIPKEEVPVDVTLGDLGMDSLMQLSLLRVLQEQFSTVNFNAIDLYKVTLDDLKHLMPDCHEPPENSWLRYVQKKNHAKIKLFCFPYGGGGASIYKSWPENFPEEIEVYPVQLPGREERMNEPSIDNLYELTTELYKYLFKDLTTPFAFFGHSLGALLAFQLTHYLCLMKAPAPQHLFISAFSEPQLPTRSLDRLVAECKQYDINFFELKNPQQIDHLSDQQMKNLTEIFQRYGFIDYSKYMEKREIMKTLLPIFISDLKLVKSYHYQVDPLLNIPMTIFSGSDDLWITKNDQLGWKNYTNSFCDFQTIAGDHLFLRTEVGRTAVIHQITQALINSIKVPINLSTDDICV